VIVIHQYCKYHWKTVLYLVNNSLICAGTNISNFTMILSFYRSKLHSISKPDKTGFPGFLFSATRNPSFKILPRIGNTTYSKASSAVVAVYYQRFLNFLCRLEVAQPNCDLCFVIKGNIWWKRTLLPMAIILALHHKYMKLVKPFTSYVTARSVRKGIWSVEL